MARRRTQIATMTPTETASTLLAQYQAAVKALVAAGGQEAKVQQYEALISRIAGK